MHEAVATAASLFQLLIIGVTAVGVITAVRASLSRFNDQLGELTTALGKLTETVHILGQKVAVLEALREVEHLVVPSTKA